MPETLEHVKRHVTNETLARIQRTVSIWEQRSIFSQEILEDIKTRLQKPNPPIHFAQPIQPAQPAQPAKPAQPPRVPAAMPPGINGQASGKSNVLKDAGPSKPDKKVTVAVPEDAKPLLRYMNVVKRVDGELEEPTLQIRSLPDMYFDQVGALEVVGTPEASAMTQEIDSALALLSSYHQRLKRKIQFEEKILLELRVLFDNETKAMKNARRRMEIVEQKFADAGEVRLRIAGSGPSIKLQPMPTTETAQLPAMTHEEMAAMLQAATAPAPPPVVTTTNLPPSPFAIMASEPQNVYQQTETNPTSVLAAIAAAAAMASQPQDSQAQLQPPIPTLGSYTLSPAFDTSTLEDYDPTLEFVKQEEEFLTAFDDNYE